jgi:hypothetical protein
MGRHYNPSVSEGNGSHYNPSVSEGNRSHYNPSVSEGFARYRKQIRRYEVYKDLEKVAREQGLSPGDWIAATLPSGSGSTEERPLSELLYGLIAAVDSTKGPRSGNARTPFGELIARKLQRQGLRGL